MSRRERLATRPTTRTSRTLITRASVTLACWTAPRTAPYSVTPPASGQTPSPTAEVQSYYLDGRRYIVFSHFFRLFVGLLPCSLLSVLEKKRLQPVVEVQNDK